MIDEITSTFKCDTSVFVYDLDKLVALYTKWNTLFPNIKAHYAVKCNPEKEIIKVLHACGAAFDCASPAEIDIVLNEGVSPLDIIYANPCKTLTDIQYASQMGIMYTTFDTICELDKIAQTSFKNRKLIMRIYACDPTAHCVLSDKYGAKEHEWHILLDHAQSLGLSIEGISFHIGSGAKQPAVFAHAMVQARRLFDMATNMHGFKIDVIDIGGGFTVDNIDAMCNSIQIGIQECFPPSLGCKIIAEPGRYFAQTLAKLYTKVIGVRDRGSRMEYIISDSLYGSFNCVIYDHANVVPYVCKQTTHKTSYRTSTIMGCTCDSFETICKDSRLPELEYGDWLLWENMGAYTIAGACDFNGIQFRSPLKIFNSTEQRKDQAQRI